MGRLQHPNIMPVHSVIRDHETGLRGLCMPYRPGRPLDQVLRRMENIAPGRRSARTLLDAAAPEDLATRPDGVGWADFPIWGSYPDACAWLAASMADALAHAHSRGILHRDVKPANILLSAAERPPAARLQPRSRSQRARAGRERLRGGTLPYMAPEQLEAFRDPGRWDEVGPTADLYALGLVLSELLTGRRPETPPADMPLPRALNDLLALRFDGWPPIRDTNPQVPHALEAIVRRCLAHDPADRYPDASAFAEDLRAFLRRRPLAHARNPDRPERIGNWFRRNRLALAVAASLLVGLASAAIAVREDPDALVDLGTLLFRASDRIATPPRADRSLRLVTRDVEDATAHDALIAKAITSYAMASRQGDEGRLVPQPMRGIP